MNDDKATIFEKEVLLHLSTSRYYCIDILPIFTSNNKCQKVLVLETNLFIVFLAGGNSSCNFISWQSKKLKYEAQISLTSETLEMLDGVEGALYTKDLFKEMCILH